VGGGTAVAGDAAQRPTDLDTDTADAEEMWGELRPPDRIAATNHNSPHTPRPRQSPLALHFHSHFEVVMTVALSDPLPAVGDRVGATSALARWSRGKLTDYRTLEGVDSPNTYDSHAGQRNVASGLRVRDDRQPWP
jgi:hypothetical protein